MIYVKAKTPQDLFKQSFVKIYEYQRKPTIPDLYREDSAVLVLENNIVDPFISFEKPLATTTFNYDLLIKDGNKRFEIEYWHYYYELIQSNKIASLIRNMTENPHTKRGVVGLWKEEYRSSEQPAPCLINMSFFIRDNKLDTNSHMRANDAYRIFYIDFHILRSVQKYVSDKLNLDVGNYTHFVDTFHIYKRDKDYASFLYKKLKK